MWVKRVAAYVQVPQDRFVLEETHQHTRNIGEFRARFLAPCAAVGAGNEQAPDWWLVLKLTEQVQGHDQLVIAGKIGPWDYITHHE